MAASSDESEDEPEWERHFTEADGDDKALAFSITVQNGNYDGVHSAVYESWVIEKMLGNIERRHDLFIVT